MKIIIDKKIFNAYPKTTIGYVIANISVKDSDTHVEQIKNNGAALLKKIGIQGSNYASHPHIEGWRTVFKNFGVNNKKYRSSVESLVKRIATGEKMWHISSIVDLYNSCSVMSMIPMGGYDLDMIKGDIILRYGQPNDIFEPLGSDEKITIAPNHIVYTDEEKVLCWLWNYKDAKSSSITKNTKKAIFFLDAAFDLTVCSMEQAIQLFEYHLVKVGAEILTDGILTAHHPIVDIEVPHLTVIEKELAPPPFYESVKHTAPKRVIEPIVSVGSHEYQVRVQKLSRLRYSGMLPWPTGKAVDATSVDIVKEFNEDQSSRIYHIAGRLVSVREHGKTLFGHLQDRTGKIQLYIKQSDIGDAAFEQFINYIDIGDIIWVEGVSFKTRVGEITLKVSAFALQSKCLHPLPEKFHGLSDVETKYRQRYLDLIANAESKERFIKRSLIIKTMRNFLDRHGFIEVETPMLHPIPGGATARPFVTHHNTLNTDLYLRIAPELYLKRLVVGGLERVYEINRSFRNEGISTRHNPEFTMVEFYAAYVDFKGTMTFVEEILRAIVSTIQQNTTVLFGQHEIDFGKPFARVTMQQAVMDYANCTADDLSEKNIDALLLKHNIVLEHKQAPWGYKLSALFEALVESKLIQPTFITDFPVEISPLAKRSQENSALVDRFELFIAGMELSNGFSELNDPFDQAERFRQQACAHSSGDVEAHHYDADYIQALEYGLPPTVGVGIGIDRLTMVLTNTSSIKDVILFPTLKNKES